MAHVRIETSVPRHRKFLAAGPAASWLWLAGVCYCNDGLTDGHIPAAALQTLGVAGAAKLAPVLVRVGLWDIDPAGDGWMVHDYLDENRSAEQVRAITGKRKKAGSSGGAASWERRAAKQSAEANDQQSASDNPSKVLNPVQRQYNDNGSTPTTTVGLARVELPPADYPAMFRQLQDAYPPQARQGGMLVQQAFIGVFQRHPMAPDELFALMLAAVANHKAGAQWRAGKVPNLQRWLEEDRWQQVHEPATETPSGKPDPWAFAKDGVA